MSEDRTPHVPTEEGRSETPDAGWSALTTRGTPPGPPIRRREGDEIHPFPETVVGEGDIRTAGETPEPLAGTSLWRDAWRRLIWISFFSGIWDATYSMTLRQAS